MKFVKFFGIFLVITCVFALSPIKDSFAHPHVFIDTDISVVIEGNALKKIKNRWVFDEYFSLDMLEVIDKNGNSKIDESEVDVAYNEAFTNLKEFNYYNQIRIDEEKLIDLNISNFKASTEDEKLVYEFDVEFNQDIALDGSQDIKISIYDDSYFVDIGLGEDEKLKVLSDDILLASDNGYQIIEDHTNAIWFDSVFPKTILIK